MGVKVEIVRKEMIKPSSPTPKHLKHHKLSFLDQLAPPVYIPLIFFYEANELLFLHGTQNHQMLKSSLSMALTSYYPLAGRARDDHTIECNDDGALFVEAKVDSDLLRFTKNPDMDDLKQLLPLDPNCLGIGIEGKKEEEEEEEEEVIVAVQVNLMDCGGTVIAVQMSHKLADGHSLVAFMKAWAAICRVGGITEEIMQPQFDLASLFTPIDLTRSRVDPTKGLTMEKIVTKRLVFNKEKLETLKRNVAASAIDRPTRVEVVSGLIWYRFLEVMKRKSGDKHDIAAVHAVNLRPRMNPSLPDQAFGNIYRSTTALPGMHKIGGENGYSGLVGKMRVAIKNVNETFVTSVQKGDDYLIEKESFEKTLSQRDMEFCRFSSWSRFPMYEVDYGWGKPVWVCTTTLPFKNVAILFNTNNGDGIEVWINLLEEDASIFETDYIV